MSDKNATSIDHLLFPRYKIIADYPGNPHKVGHILEYARGDDWDKKHIETCKKYPHLFKELAWHEERPKEDMPKYIKHGGVVYPLTGEKIERYRDRIIVIYPLTESDIMFSDSLPATETDYLKYINQKQ
jgi:hypothetical protein